VQWRPLQQPLQWRERSRALVYRSANRPSRIQDRARVRYPTPLDT